MKYKKTLLTTDGGKKWDISLNLCLSVICYFGESAGLVNTGLAKQVFFVLLFHKKLLKFGSFSNLLCIIFY